MLQTVLLQLIGNQLHCISLGNTADIQRYITIVDIYRAVFFVDLYMLPAAVLCGCLQLLHGGDTAFLILLVCQRSRLTVIMPDV